MDDSPASDRLRIDMLGRSGAAPAELRRLVEEAEAPAPRAGDGEEVVERLRAAPHGT
jgi:hypothetical protein